MKYLFLCTNCGHKHFTDGTVPNELVELNSAPPPKNANGISKDTTQLPKKFKCYKCGFTFKMIKNTLEKPQETKEEYTEVSTEQYLSQWQNEVLKSARNKSQKSL